MATVLLVPGAVAQCDPMCLIRQSEEQSPPSDDPDGEDAVASQDADHVDRLLARQG